MNSNGYSGRQDTEQEKRVNESHGSDFRFQPGLFKYGEWRYGSQTEKGMKGSDE
jgi:hypothetical protein